MSKLRLIELQAENFKRLKAVRIRPSKNVTPIVGANGAGKTSVLDAIAAALGGASECPDKPIRAGEERAQSVVDLGDLKVRRRWTPTGSTLEVFRANGTKVSSAQKELDSLMGNLSFDPLEFSRLKPMEQAALLAKIAGIDLAKMARERKEVYDERTVVNRQKKVAEAILETTPPVDAPDAETSVTEMLAKLKAAQDVNAAADEEVAKGKRIKAAVDVADRELGRLQMECLNADKKLKDYQHALKECEDKAASMERHDIAPIQAELAALEQTNAKVRAKKARDEKVAEVKQCDEKSYAITKQIDSIDLVCREAVRRAKLPIDGLELSFEGVRVNGIPFADCSGSEKLRTSVAIGLALNPKLKLMLIRDGSLLDAGGMKLLAEIAEKNDAQVLIERVSDGDEIGVQIVDGEVAGVDLPVLPEVEPEAKPAAPVEEKSETLKECEF